MLAVPSAFGTIEVNVTRVGFPSLQSDVVRPGRWAPVLVDIALVNQAEAHGVARVSQPDIDGDRPYDEVPFHLRAENGGSQRLVLYVLPSYGETAIQVDFFDESGEALPVVSQGVMTFPARPAQQPTPLPDDDLLVLSVSTGTIGPLAELGDAIRQQHLARGIHVGHIGPTDLPEHWFGLEAVDVIVWDDADPADVTERQWQALVDWTGHGGILVVAASRTAASLALSPHIATRLPVDLGEVAAVTDLPAMRRRMMTTLDTADRPIDSGPPWWEAPYDPPIPIVRCRARPGAASLMDVQESPSLTADEVDLLTYRGWGRGGLFFLGVTLRDLFRGGGDIRDFFLLLAPNPKLTQPDRGMGAPQSLFAPVVSAVSFATSGGVYLVFAMLFSIGYFLAATFGSWAALGARGWRHHSWSGFAIVGLAASLLSVLIVNAVRGLGDSLHQISVVDLEAGSARGWGTSYFGLKTGIDRRMDVWLPADALSAESPGQSTCFLRPLPASAQETNIAGFADPEPYRLIPASAVVNDVRIRGTLKRFEGRWDGTVAGHVDAGITVKRRAIQLEPGSFVINRLGVDLRDCYLLHTTSEAEPGRGFRAADIYAHPLGEIKQGARIDLAEVCYARPPEQTLADFLKRRSLQTMHAAWAGELRSRVQNIGRRGAIDMPTPLGSEEAALLLLATLGEYDPAEDRTMFAQAFGKSWSRDRARQLDLSPWLRPSTVVLMGFADDPGPARLFRRVGDRPFAPMEPDARRARTLYRIRIPVTIMASEAPSPSNASESG